MYIPGYNKEQLGYLLLENYGVCVCVRKITRELQAMQNLSIE